MVEPVLTAILVVLLALGFVPRVVRKLFLAEAGLPRVEATSFVSPRWIPQLADADQVVPALPPGPSYAVLVPNDKGLARLLAAHPELGTEVLAASIRHPLHVAQVAMAGADVATLPPNVFRQLIEHPLTDKGLAAFLADWAKTGQTVPRK